MTSTHYSKDSYFRFDLGLAIVAVCLGLLGVVIHTKIWPVLYSTLGSFGSALHYVGLALLIFALLFGIASTKRREKDGRWVHTNSFSFLGTLVSGFFALSMSRIVKEQTSESSDQVLGMIDYVAVFGLIFGLLLLCSGFLIRILIERDNRKQNILEAAEYGNLKQVNRLIRRGVDINTRHTHDGYTALIKAAYRGHIEVVEFLLDKGADKLIEDKWGRNAQKFAEKFLEGRSKETIISLLAKSRNFDIR